MVAHFNLVCCPSQPLRHLELLGPWEEAFPPLRCPLTFLLLKETNMGRR